MQFLLISHHRNSTHIFPSFTIPYLVHEPQIGFHRSFLYITIFYPKKDPVGINLSCLTNVLQHKCHTTRYKGMFFLRRGPTSVHKCATAETRDPTFPPLEHARHPSPWDLRSLVIPMLCSDL